MDMQQSLETLEAAVSKRQEALRATYHHMVRSLMARTELQLLKIPPNIRAMRVRDIVSVQSSQSRISSGTQKSTKSIPSSSPTKLIKAVKKGRVEKTSTIESKKGISRRIKKV